MNQRLGWEDEASSRAVNAKPWQPMPGMEKRQCTWCRYFFAADPATTEPRCPDCASFGTKSPSGDPT